MDDKVNRILAIDAEKKNADLCDYVIEFTEYDEAIEKLSDLLKI